MSAVYYTGATTEAALVVLVVLGVAWVLWASRHVESRAEREEGSAG